MRRRNIILLLLIIVTVTLGWFGYRVVKTLHRIPEAYAAWDTGTLLVEYMKTNDDRWPKSWDDLLSIMNTESGNQIPLRGAQAGDAHYARTLRDKVAIDWGSQRRLGLGAGLQQS